MSRPSITTDEDRAIHAGLVAAAALAGCVALIVLGSLALWSFR